MTTNLINELYEFYLYWKPRDQKAKKLEDVTLKDLLLAAENESETAHDLEVERQIDEIQLSRELN